MTDTQNAVGQILVEIQELLRPLERAAEGREQLFSLLLQLNWDFPGLRENDVASVADSVRTLSTELETLAESASFDDATAALEALQRIATAIKELIALREVIATVARTDLSSESLGSLGLDLLSFLVLDYIQRRAPALFQVGVALGVIADELPAAITGSIAGRAFTLRHSGARLGFSLDGLGSLLRDPPAHLERLYFSRGLSTTADAEEAALRLFSPLRDLAVQLGGFGRAGAEGALPESIASPANGALRRSGTFAMPIRSSDTIAGFGGGAIGVNAELVARDSPLSGGSAGVRLSTFGDVSVDTRLGDWSALMTLAGTSGGFFVGPGTFTAGPGGDVRASVKLARGTKSAPAFLVGSAKGSRLSIDVITLILDAAFGAARELLFDFSLDGGSLAILPGSPDGFLAKILPPDGLETRFDLGVGWSTSKGVHFRASGGLRVTIPVHKSIGPVTIDSLYVAFDAAQDLLELSIAASFNAEIGPIAASVERVGLSLPFSFPEGGGNFGPLQFDRPRFLPPTGGGLALDAGPLTGGGFISHDAALGRYDGILDLKLAEIGLTAIAMISTKLPNGRPGFALFINIGITFSPPISLPYNFTFMGCGGLCAINRTTDVEALRSGVRNKTLNSILFPEDPILNANKIITDSERVFPIQEGRFVVGPMVRIGWGADDLVIADIALVLEIPEPIMIALLGQVKIRVPKSEEAKIKLNLDVVGILDVAKESLSFDATLYDSRILVYELYGDSALRLNWGSKPTFAMSVGGFHPKFTPPPSFPKLRRLTIELRSGGNFEFTFKLYHAITSNSLQFGADFRLHAEACGGRLDGQMTFDALFIFSPFEFDVSMSGSVSASYEGHHIASIRLSLDLSGPTPWHAKGKASISILFFDISVHFDTTWGNDNKARLPKVDPLPAFLEELSKPGNWNASFLPRRSVAETLKAIDAAANAGSTAATSFALLAHPAGGLEFRQRYVPLDLELDKVGNADVKNHSKLDVAMSVVVPGSADPPLVETGQIEEYFARGQYKTLSKSSRLSKPSYELFKAGVGVAAERARLDGAPQPCELEYQSILITRDERRSQRLTSATPWRDLRRSIGVSALQLNAVQKQGIGKFKGVLTTPHVLMRDEAYAAVDAATLVASSVVQSASSARLTQTVAEDRVGEAVATGQLAVGSVLVVPDYERAPV